MYGLFVIYPICIVFSSMWWEKKTGFEQSILMYWTEGKKEQNEGGETHSERNIGRS